MRRIAPCLGQAFGLALFLLFPVCIPSALAHQNTEGSPARTDLEPALRNASRREPLVETVVHVSGFSYLNNRERLLDELLDARNAAVELETGVRQLRYFPGDEDKLIRLLKGMDGKATTAQAGIGLVLGIPWRDDRYTLTTTARTRFAGTFEYEPSDEPKLRLAPLISFIELSELESRVRVSGFGVGELALHRRIDEISLPATTVTVSLKHQEIWLYERDVPIQRYRESDLFKLSDFTRKFSRPNIDLSSVTELDQWRFGVRIENLLADTLRGLQGSPYELKPRASLTVSRRWEWGRVGLFQDVSAQPAFGQVMPRRETIASIEVPLGQRWEVGAGYQAVAMDRDHDAVSLSLRYRLLDSFYLGVSAMAAGRHELGGTFRIQMPL